MKRLYLCRHAKSSWKDSGMPDIQRPLNHRGEKDLPAMGQRLAALGVTVDAIHTSPAVRALATAHGLAKALGFPEKGIVVVDRMYGAPPHLLLSLIQSLAAELHAVALVGHNPATTILFNLLTQAAIDNVPTCGVAAIDFPGTIWAQVVAGSGHLAFFEYPKKTESFTP